MSRAPLLALVLACAACGTQIALGVLDEATPGPGDAGVVDASEDAPSLVEDAAPPPPDSPEGLGCAFKACGTECVPCDGGSCPPPSVFHVCNDKRECVAEDPHCIGISIVDSGKRDRGRCAGKVCGAPCVCEFGQSCPLSQGVCAATGLCEPSPTACR